jgi:hypothetical protein
MPKEMMTRSKTPACYRRSEKAVGTQAIKSRSIDWQPIRGLHQGSLPLQQTYPLNLATSKAGHMTATPVRFATKSNSP